MRQQTIGWGIAAVTLAILWCSSASAQDRTKLNAFQLELHKKADAAYLSGDYGKAVTLYETSMEAGAANITTLSLGRALFKMGRCEEADKAFDRVLTTPKVARPKPAEVLKALERYRKEMNAQCGGRVRIACAHPAMTIQIDDQPPEACPEEVKVLVPGPHKLTGRLYGQVLERRITLEALALEKVDFKLDTLQRLDAAEEAAAKGKLEDALGLYEGDASARNSKRGLVGLSRALTSLKRCEEAAAALDKAPDGHDPAPEDFPARLEEARVVLASGCGIEIDKKDLVEGPPDELPEDPTGSSGAMTTWGWITVGTGVAGVAVGIAVDAFVLGPSFDDLDAAGQDGDEAAFTELKGDVEDTQGLNTFIFVAGGALIATGGVLILLDAMGDDEERAQRDAVSLDAWLGEGTGGLKLKGRW